MAAILVIDDDPLVLKRIETLLVRKGYQVHCANGGDRALEIAANEDLDVAIVDYHMPGRNGLEVMLELRKVAPACRRILLSGAMDVAVVMDAVNRCGVSQVLQKPFVPKDLISAIDDAIAAKKSPFAVTRSSSSSSADRDDQCGPGCEVAEYVIEQMLGRGGMATVYGAVHPVIGKRAAIKVLNPGMTELGMLQERFIREARAVNRIGHPNIVDIFSTGMLADGRLYLVMEWIEGETLECRMEREPLCVREILNVLDQLCAAVEAAHGKGVIHRDIKPQNVMLAPGEKVKLLDFGIAKLTDAVTHATRPGAILGTPHYLSPEQIVGDEVDRSTDIYSIGVLAFELFTGALPFQADSLSALALQHLMVEPPSLRSIWDQIPVSLERPVLAMMAKKPEDRPSLSKLRELLPSLGRTPFAALTPPRRQRSGVRDTEESDVFELE